MASKRKSETSGSKPTQPPGSQEQPSDSQQPSGPIRSFLRRSLTSRFKSPWSKAAPSGPQPAAAGSRPTGSETAPESEQPAPSGRRRSETTAATASEAAAEQSEDGRRSMHQPFLTHPPPSTGPSPQPLGNFTEMFHRTPPAPPPRRSRSSGSQTSLSRRRTMSFISELFGRPPPGNTLSRSQSMRSGSSGSRASLTEAVGARPPATQAAGSKQAGPSRSGSKMSLRQSAKTGDLPDAAGPSSGRCHKSSSRQAGNQLAGPLGSQLQARAGLSSPSVDARYFGLQGITLPSPSPSSRSKI